MSIENPSQRNSPTFGVRLPTSGPLATVSTVVSTVDTLAKLGYDSVWTNDHISWIPDSLTHFSAGAMEAVANQDPNFFESLTTASFILSRTPNIRVVISALVLPLRDPRILARQLITIDALSGGRLTLAMGMGGEEHDFEVLGVSWKERGKIGDEYLAALDAALFGNPLSTYEGERIKFNGAGFYPKPSGLKKWIVGVSQAAFRRAGKWGDGWMETTKSPKSFGEHCKAFHESLLKHGRSDASVTCGGQVSITIGTSYEHAVKLASRTLARRFGTAENGLEAAAVGTSQQVAEKLNEYIDEGADHLGLKLIVKTREGFLELAQQVKEEVLPLLDR